MAPEAVRGELTTSVDVYCFGVVVLQVVSGLKTLDEDREEKNIVSVLAFDNNSISYLLRFYLSRSYSSPVSSR